MRILHTGDIHLGDLAGPTKDGENLRRLDTIGCMKAIVEDCGRCAVCSYAEEARRAQRTAGG